MSPGRGGGVRPGLAPRAAALLVALATGPLLAGPVLVYREGPEFCPRDRPPGSPRITPEQAVERARALLPREFCAPGWYVSGCEFDPEWSLESWRVYAQQYKDDNGRRVYAGRDHSYVILDPVGNCLANIPGT